MKRKQVVPMLLTILLLVCAQPVFAPEANDVGTATEDRVQHQGDEYRRQEAGKPPVSPFDDPKLANNPHAWLDFLGYYLEVAMLAFALQLLVTACIFGYLKEKGKCIAAIIAALVVAIPGIAAPGLLILADDQLLNSDADRWLLIKAVGFFWLIAQLLVASLPVVVAFKARRLKKRKVLVCGFSIASLFIGLFWPIAMFFAFSKDEPKP